MSISGLEPVYSTSERAQISDTQVHTYRAVLAVELAHNQTRHLILISILRAKDKKLFMKSLIDEEEIQVGQSDYKDLLIDKDTYIPNNDIEVEIEKDKEEILHTDLEEASKESESVDK